MAPPDGDVYDIADTGRGLPLVELFDSGTSDMRYYSVTTIDDRGRLADRTFLTVLGWQPGAPITVAMVPRAGLVVVRAGGCRAVTRQGHLRLPANIRHGCRLHGGERLLAVAHRTEGIVIIYTPTAIDAMVAAYHSTLSTVDSS